MGQLAQCIIALLEGNNFTFIANGPRVNTRSRQVSSRACKVTRRTPAVSVTTGFASVAHFTLEFELIPSRLNATANSGHPCESSPRNYRSINDSPNISRIATVSRSEEDEDEHKTTKNTVPNELKLNYHCKHTAHSKTQRSHCWTTLRLTPKAFTSFIKVTEH